MLKSIDSRALKILSKYNAVAAFAEIAPYPLSAWEKEILEQHRTPPENMAYLKQHGLAFDSIKIKHDEAAQKCFEYYAQCTKKHIVDSFLVSLSSNRLDYRSGLAPYAIMQTMPDHIYQQTEALFCKICSAQETDELLDLTNLNQQRFCYGTMIGVKTPYEIQFFLQQHLTLEAVSPTAADFEIFNAIVSLINQAEATTKPNEIAKKIRTVPGFKASVDQCKYLIEILGFCSIMESEKHKGYLTKYTNPGLAPSKSHSSNWAYPVDFWTGKDGINREAFDFWFGDCKEINNP